MQSESLFLANKRLNELEINSNKLVLESMPQRLLLVPTSKCNLRCIMCSRVGSDSTLPLHAIKKIFPLFPYLETIDIQGGEPFLVDYFEELLLGFAAFPHARISLLTNGLLIDRKWADLLIRNNMHLSFSIDSVVQETYEHIRRGARFADLLKSLDLISELKQGRGVKSPLQKINVVVMKSNYKELSLFPQFCKRYGFPELTFDYLRPDIAASEDIFTIGYDPSVLCFLNGILPEIKANCKDLGIEFNFDGLLPFLNHDPNKKNHIRSGAIQNKICRLPWKKLFIDSDGTIRPDCLCNQAVCNLIDIDTIFDTWNNEIMQAYRKKISVGAMDNWCSDACQMDAVAPQYREGN